MQVSDTETEVEAPLAAVTVLTVLAAVTVPVSPAPTWERYTTLYSELRAYHEPKDCGFGSTLTGSCLYQSFADQLLRLRGASRSQQDIDIEAGCLRDITCSKLMSEPRDAWIEKWHGFSREDACELVLRNDGWTASTPFADEIGHYVSCAAGFPALVFDDDSRTARVIGVPDESPIEPSTVGVVLIRERHHYRSSRGPAPGGASASSAALLAAGPLAALSYENDIIINCLPCDCGLEIPRSRHTCNHCSRRMHPWCGKGVGEEGDGQKRTCRRCLAKPVTVIYWT